MNFDSIQIIVLLIAHIFFHINYNMLMSNICPFFLFFRMIKKYTEQSLLTIFIVFYFTHFI